MIIVDEFVVFFVLIRVLLIVIFILFDFIPLRYMPRFLVTYEKQNDAEKTHDDKTLPTK